MKDRITNYIKAGFPAIALRTAEEGRALAVLKEVAEASKKNLFVWTASRGIEQPYRANERTYKGYNGGAVPNTDNPKAAADATLADSQGGDESLGILVMCDLHAWMTNGLDAYTERAIKDLLRVAPARGVFVVFLGPDFRPPMSIEKFVTILDFELPTRDELEDILAHAEESAKKSKIKLDALTNGEREAALRAACGLTAPEAENAYCLAIIEGGADKKLRAETVAREKAASVRRSGLMEIIDPDPRGLDAIGGYEVLKDWLLQRQNAYTKKARDFGLPPPKGVLLAGQPGCGKSLAARCAATVFKTPSLRLDVGCLLAGIVGESEARTRQALALAEAVAPCVLWIDEIDKALAGSRGSGELDSGVGRRILGTLLTWMQDHKSDVFIFATANQVWQLPPELLRRGRFDELFFLSLPTAKEREEIIKIHLAKRNRDPKKFRIDEIVKTSEDFTGAEIEAAIVAAMYTAFEENREVGTAHITAACKVTKKQSITMAEDIAMLEKWGTARARSASREVTTKGDTFRRLVGNPEEEPA